MKNENRNSENDEKFQGKKKENEICEKRKMKKCSVESSEKQVRVQSRITYWMKKERNPNEKCENDENYDKDKIVEKRNSEMKTEIRRKIEKRKENSVKKKLEQDIDNKTPKSKFKSVLNKFEGKVNDEREEKYNEDSGNPRNPKNSDKLKVNFVTNFESLGASWKVSFMETQLPSSVRSQRKSAAVCARGGQYVDKIGPSDMSGAENGFQKRNNGKRKCNLMEENTKINLT